MSRRTGSGALALAALLAAAAPAVAEAALAVHAAVDRDEIAADETVTLELRVEADTTPSFRLPKQGFDFTVVSQASSQSWSASLGGGAGVQIRQVTTFQFGLSPRRTGQLTIPPIQVVAGQASADTQAIPIKVLPAGSRPAQPPGGGRAGAPRGASPFGAPGAPGGLPGGSRAWHGWERELALRVELDKQEAFLGEQVTATLAIVSPVGVVDLGGFQPPQYDGFWTEELERAQQLTPQVRQIDGVPMRVYPYLTLALFPTRAGELELGSFELSMVVRVGADDPFDPFPDVRRVTRRSQPVKLTVKPLPPGAPAGFDSVDVGTMSLGAALSERTVAVGQPVTWRLTAQGEGNVKAWSLPALPRVPGLRAFAPTSSDKVAPQRGRLAGSRTIETVLVPEQPGTLVVPAVSWPVFDPRAGKYKVLATQPLELQVLPAGPPERSAAAAAPGQNALGGGLRPIRSGGALVRRADPPWSGPPFWILLAAPVVLFATLTGLDRLRERHAADGGARRLRLAGRVARKRLATAAQLAETGEPGPFFLELERALIGYCGDKLLRPASGLTREELHRALTDAGAHPPAVRAVTVALDACDAGRFGGAGARVEALALASRAMELLEEAHWKGPGGDA